ncbi:hypothetical protein LUZ62_053600 [Rhynchospora pubera]|uniref:Pentatricopeptide repeat-containing protein n=1 Tax=Rhynchospora pubera TaxID=906938 RepID=A0AAV8DSP7_9POAL|nr:hypothetical protein LUZ62_053600 [Rhynchospora pubera]
MHARGVVTNVYTYNSLIHGLCKNGSVNAAQKVFENMHAYGIVADLYTYSVLIHSFCRQGSMHSAVNLFDEMIAKGVVPDVYNYNDLILGRINEALHLVKKMMKQGLKPDRVTSGIILNALRKSENPDELRQIISEIISWKKTWDMWQIWK